MPNAQSSNRPNCNMIYPWASLNKCSAPKPCRKSVVMLHKQKNEVFSKRMVLNRHPKLDKYGICV